MKKGKQYGLIIPKARDDDSFDFSHIEAPKTDLNAPYPDLKYNIPDWGSISSLQKCQYFFEVIKEGKQIETVEFTNTESKMQEKGWLLFGRLPEESQIPHFALLHPTISRQHAVLQVNFFYFIQ